MACCGRLCACAWRYVAGGRCSLRGPGCAVSVSVSVSHERACVSISNSLCEAATGCRAGWDSLFASFFSFRRRSTRELRDSGLCSVRRLCAAMAIPNTSSTPAAPSGYSLPPAALLQLIETCHTILNRTSHRTIHTTLVLPMQSHTQKERRKG